MTLGFVCVAVECARRAGHRFYVVGEWICVRLAERFCFHFVVGVIRRRPSWCIYKWFSYII